MRIFSSSSLPTLVLTAALAWLASIACIALVTEEASRLAAAPAPMPEVGVAPLPATSPAGGPRVRTHSTPPAPHLHYAGLHPAIRQK